MCAATASNNIGMTPPNNVPKIIVGINLMANWVRRKTGRHNCPSITPDLRSSATAVQPISAGITGHSPQNMFEGKLRATNLREVPKFSRCDDAEVEQDEYADNQKLRLVELKLLDEQSHSRPPYPIFTRTDFEPCQSACLRHRDGAASPCHILRAEK